MKGRLQNLAEARKRTSHWIMREAISQYVEREEKSEALRLDTLQGISKNCPDLGAAIS